MLKWPLLAFVPSPMFDGTQMDSFLKHHVDLRPSDFITHDKLDFLETVNVYVPFVNVNNMLLDAFGQFSYFHASSVLANAVAKKTEKLTWALHIETGLAYSMVYKKNHGPVFRVHSQNQWHLITDRPKCSCHGLYER